MSVAEGGDISSPLIYFERIDRYGNEQRVYPMMLKDANGWYRNPDGQPEYSDGRAKGRSLEKLGRPEFMPQEAIHIIETEINFTIPGIEEDIADTVANGIADMIASEFKSIRIEL